jgi:hypothetical protein
MVFHLDATFFHHLPAFIRNGSFYYHDFCRFLEKGRPARPVLSLFIPMTGTPGIIVFEPFGGIAVNLSEMVRFDTTFLARFSNLVGVRLRPCIYSFSPSTARNPRFFAEYGYSRIVPLEPVRDKV